MALRLEVNDTSKFYLKHTFGAKKLEFISETNARHECEEKGLVWHDLIIDQHIDEGYKVINATTEQLLRPTNNLGTIILQHKITGSVIKNQFFSFQRLFQ